MYRYIFYQNRNPCAFKKSIIMSSLLHIPYLCLFSQSTKMMPGILVAAENINVSILVSLKQKKIYKYIQNGFSFFQLYYICTNIYVHFYAKGQGWINLRKKLVLPCGFENSVSITILYLCYQIICSTLTNFLFITNFYLGLHFVNYSDCIKIQMVINILYSFCCHV